MEKGEKKRRRKVKFKLDGENMRKAEGCHVLYGSVFLGSNLFDHLPAYNHTYPDEKSCGN